MDNHPMVQKMGDIAIHILNSFRSSGTEALEGTVTRTQTKENFLHEVTRNLLRVDVWVLVFLIIGCVIWLTLTSLSCLIWLYKRKEQQYVDGSIIRSIFSYHLKSVSVIFLLIVGLALIIVFVTGPSICIQGTSKSGGFSTRMTSGFGGSILIMSEDQMDMSVTDSFHWANESLWALFRLSRSFKDELKEANDYLWANTDKESGKVYSLNERVAESFFNHTGSKIEFYINDAHQLEEDVNRLLHELNATKKIFAVFTHKPLAELKDYVENLNMLVQDIKKDAEVVIKKAKPSVKIILHRVLRATFNVHMDLDSNVTLDAFDKCSSIINEIPSHDIVSEINQLKSDLRRIIDNLPTNVDDLAIKLSHATFRTMHDFENVVEEVNNGLEKAFPDDMQSEVSQNFTTYGEKLERDFSNLCPILIILGICAIVIGIAFAVSLCLTFSATVFHPERNRRSELPFCGLKTLNCTIFAGAVCLVVFWFLAVAGYILSLIPLMMCESFDNGNVFNLTIDNVNFWKGANESAPVLPWENTFAPRVWGMKFKTTLWRCKNNSGLYEAFSLDTVFPEFQMNLSDVEINTTGLESHTEENLQMLPMLRLPTHADFKNNISEILDHVDFKSFFLNVSNIIAQVMNSDMWPALKDLSENSEANKMLKIKAIEAEDMVTEIDTLASTILGGQDTKDYFVDLKDMKRLGKKINQNLQNLHAEGKVITDFVNTTAKKAILTEASLVPQILIRGIEYQANHLMYYVRHHLLGCSRLWYLYDKISTKFCHELLNSITAAWLAVSIVSVFLVLVIILGVIASNVFRKLIHPIQPAEESSIALREDEGSVDSGSDAVEETSDQTQEPHEEGKSPQQDRETESPQEDRKAGSSQHDKEAGLPQQDSIPAIPE